MESFGAIHIPRGQFMGGEGGMAKFHACPRGGTRCIPLSREGEIICA